MNPDGCTDDDIRTWLGELTTGKRPLIRIYQNGAGTYIELDDEPPPQEGTVTPLEVVAMGEAVMRKRPARARAANGLLAGHDPDTVKIVRNALDSLALTLRIPNADDGILVQVLTACRGAPGVDIAEAIRGLYLRDRFREMRSWGLVAVALAPYFQTNARSG